MEEHDANHVNSRNKVHSNSSGDTTSDPPEAQRTRKSHKKSRNGCQYCKRRRIKCDEIRPACDNCLRFSIPCIYTPPGVGVETTGLASEPRKRGRPRKNWTVVSVGFNTTQGPSHDPTISSTSSSLTLSVNSGLPLEKPWHIPWDAQDLELFFHYLNEVCVGLGVGDRQLWRDRVPRLAFCRHGVLHLILAVSALHLARRESNRCCQLEERAEMHLTIGLRRVTEILPNLSAENCAELYVATILVCICNFAKRPGPGHLLLVADGSEVAWWELFRGVRIIVESIGLSTVFSGELGPLPSDTEGDQQDENPRHHRRVSLNVIEWEAPLGCLSSLISSTLNGSARDTCQNALNIMTWCFQETYGTTARPKPAIDAKFNIIMAWPYCLPDEFIASLRHKEPVPLILLAHFGILLQTLESAWFLEGWATHVLRAVAGTLEPTWSEWLRWPTVQIERVGDIGVPLEASDNIDAGLVHAVQVPADDST